MRTIPTDRLTIADIPQAKVNNWGKISIFALTIPQEELAAESGNLRPLINADFDITEFSTSVIRGHLYVTQRILNNQEGSPDTATMMKIVEAVTILRARCGHIL